MKQRTETGSGGLLLVRQSVRVDVQRHFDLAMAKACGDDVNRREVSGRIHIATPCRRSTLALPRRLAILPAGVKQHHRRRSRDNGGQASNDPDIRGRIVTVVLTAEETRPNRVDDEQADRRSTCCIQRIAQLKKIFSDAAFTDRGLFCPRAIDHWRQRCRRPQHVYMLGRKVLLFFNSAQPHPNVSRRFQLPATKSGCLKGFAGFRLRMGCC